MASPARIDRRKWRKAIELQGWSAFGAACRIGAFRYRQPFRDVRTTAPGPWAAVLLTVAIACSAQWSGSATDPLIGFAVVAASAALISLFTVVTPPTVLYLAISDYEQFTIMKMIQSLGDLTVLSLINQASRGVSNNYRQHYRPLIALARADGPIGWAVSTLAPMANATTPRFDSLRTRPGRWRQTLCDAVDVSPLVVLDARDPSRYVLEEALWMLAPERIHKCLFVIEDDGGSPVLDRIASLGLGTIPSGARTVTAEGLGPLLLALTRTAGTLPTRGATTPPLDQVAALTEAGRRLEAMTGLLEDLLERVGAKNEPDGDLDERIAAWDGGFFPGRGADAPYTESLDAVLEMAQRHLSQHGARCSYGIDIAIDGDAKVSIGLQSRPGNLRVFESDDHTLGPPRAALQAFFRVLLS